MRRNEILLGAAYYNEYMPYERIKQDFELMKKIGLNVIRIAESTWSTWEPEDGVFDFTKLTDVLKLACEYEIQVIVGTPSYAIPSWLANKHPEIMSTTKEGQLLYGGRQSFDITSRAYRYHVNRIIRKMMDTIYEYPCIIGYQLDNECRSAHAAGPDTQVSFVESLQSAYPDIEDFNREFGMDYWSNRIGKWEDFPDVRGTINGSLSAAYKRYLRECIADFLNWQAGIVREYMTPSQFLTHNFDPSWVGYSYGLQPEVDQRLAGKCFDVAGIDIYHPSQDALTGAEIAFGGALARAIKKSNYLVLETQSQGQLAWLPYPGQLRLQAYSHLANGSNSVMYWNWHSIHNSFETYWKGILSHDLEPGETYNQIGEYIDELLPIQRHLLNLRKNNSAAILIDNASLTGIEEFKKDNGLDYNEILRKVFDACYDMNLETDFIYKEDDFNSYNLLIIPALYSADNDLINKIREYVENGGHVIMTFKSCFADNELKVYSDTAPHDLTDIFGIEYDQFTVPGTASLLFDDGQSFGMDKFIELIRPHHCVVWAKYAHPYWGRYAAVTHNKSGKGSATYVGCNCDKNAFSKIIRRVANEAGIALPGYQFPIIRRLGVNDLDEHIEYLFNYSFENQTIVCSKECTDLLTNTCYREGEGITLTAWNLVILRDDSI